MATEEVVENAAHEASPWVRVLARVGFASRGVLSCIIGVLAVMAALGSGRGTTTDSKGALRIIYDQPFGQVLLVLVAVGLFGYSVWLFVQAILDPERTARRPKRGPLMRIGRFIAGLLHVGLGLYAVGLVTGIALGSDEDGAKSWTARLLGWEGIGIAIVIAFGLFVIGLGAVDIYKAFKNKLDQQLDLSSLSRTSRRIIVDICRFGLGARAVVFALIGAFLILAAVRTDPHDAKGLGETLAHIGRASYGLILLAIVALGFVAYGVYQLVEARYRRIHAG
jgi:hypothetical protein